MDDLTQNPTQFTTDICETSGVEPPDAFHLGVDEIQDQIMESLQWSTNLQSPPLPTTPSPLDPPTNVNLLFEGERDLLGDLQGHPEFLKWLLLRLGENFLSDYENWLANPSLTPIPVSSRFSRILLETIKNPNWSVHQNMQEQDKQELIKSWRTILRENQRFVHFEGIFWQTWIEADPNIDKMSSHLTVEEKIQWIVGVLHLFIAVVQSSNTTEGFAFTNLSVPILAIAKTKDDLKRFCDSVLICLEKALGPEIFPERSRRCWGTLLSGAGLKVLKLSVSDCVEYQHGQIHLWRPKSGTWELFITRLHVTSLYMYSNKTQTLKYDVDFFESWEIDNNPDCDQEQKKFVFGISNQHEEMIFATESKEEMTSWIKLFATRILHCEISTKLGLKRDKHKPVSSVAVQVNTGGVTRLRARGFSSAAGGPLPRFDRNRVVTKKKIKVIDGTAPAATPKAAKLLGFESKASRSAMELDQVPNTSTKVAKLLGIENEAPSQLPSALQPPRPKRNESSLEIKDPVPGSKTKQPIHPISPRKGSNQLLQRLKLFHVDADQGTDDSFHVSEADATFLHDLDSGVTIQIRLRKSPSGLGKEFSFSEIFPSDEESERDIIVLPPDMPNTPSIKSFIGQAVDHLRDQTTPQTERISIVLKKDVIKKFTEAPSVENNDDWEDKKFTFRKLDLRREVFQHPYQDNFDFPKSPSDVPPPLTPPILPEIPPIVPPIQIPSSPRKESQTKDPDQKINFFNFLSLHLFEERTTTAPPKITRKGRSKSTETIRQAVSRREPSPPPKAKGVNINEPSSPRGRTTTEPTSPRGRATERSPSLGRKKSGVQPPGTEPNKQQQQQQQQQWNASIPYQIERKRFISNNPSFGSLFTIVFPNGDHVKIPITNNTLGDVLITQLQRRQMQIDKFQLKSVNQTELDPETPIHEIPSWIVYLEELRTKPLAKRIVRSKSVDAAKKKQVVQRPFHEFVVYDDIFESKFNPGTISPRNTSNAPSSPMVQPYRDRINDKPASQNMVSPLLSPRHTENREHKTSTGSSGSRETAFQIGTRSEEVTMGSRGGKGRPVDPLTATTKPKPPNVPPLPHQPQEIETVTESEETKKEKSKPEIEVSGEFLQANRKDRRIEELKVKGNSAVSLVEFFSAEKSDSVDIKLKPKEESLSFVEFLQTKAPERQAGTSKGHPDHSDTKPEILSRSKKPIERQQTEKQRKGPLSLVDLLDSTDGGIELKLKPKTEDNDSKTKKQENVNRDTDSDSTTTISPSPSLTDLPSMDEPNPEQEPLQPVVTKVNPFTTNPIKRNPSVPSETRRPFLNRNLTNKDPVVVSTPTHHETTEQGSPPPVTMPHSVQSRSVLTRSDQGRVRNVVPHEPITSSPIPVQRNHSGSDPDSFSSSFGSSPQNDPISIAATATLPKPRPRPTLGPNFSRTRTENHNATSSNPSSPPPERIEIETPNEISKSPQAPQPLPTPPGSSPILTSPAIALQYLTTRTNQPQPETDISLVEFKSEWWAAFTIEDHVSSLRAIEDNVWVGSNHGDLAIFDSKGEQLLKIKAHKSSIHAITELDGKVYTASSDTTINQWNTQGKLKKTLKGHMFPVTVLIGVETKKGHFLWSGDQSGNIIIWKGDKEVHSLQLPNKSSCFSIAYIPRNENKNQIWVGSKVWIYVFDTETFQQVGQYKAMREHEITSFTLLEKDIFCCCDGAISVWDKETHLKTHAQLPVPNIQDPKIVLPHPILSDFGVVIDQEKLVVFNRRKFTPIAQSPSDMQSLSNAIVVGTSIWWSTENILTKWNFQL